MGMVVATRMALSGLGKAPISLATPFDLLYGTFEHVNSPELLPHVPGISLVVEQVVKIFLDQQGHHGVSRFEFQAQAL